MPVMDPNPIEIQEFMLVNPDQMIGYLMASWWDPVDNIAMVSCPLCASLVENSWQARQKHSVYHVMTLRMIKGLQ